MDEVLVTAISLSGNGRIKDIYSLPSDNAAIMIRYINAAELNERGSQSAIRGYYKCRGPDHRHVQGEVSLGLPIILDTTDEQLLVNIISPICF